MNPRKMTVYELFERDLRYVVPLYQRAYVWEEEGEWEPLWEDIRSRAEEVLRVGRTHPVRPHFLGALVTRGRERSSPREVHADEVIDGQQRLTTLQIFLAACRDLMTTDDTEPGISARFDKLTTIDLLGIDDGDQRLKIWPTNTDRAAFRRVLEARSAEVLGNWLVEEDRAYRTPPRIARAYMYFSKAVKAWMYAHDPDYPTLDLSVAMHKRALFEAIRDHLQVVVIKLDPEDDPQVIFETLNATGQPLLPSDLVRNFVFNEANRLGEDPDELYNRLWQTFEDSASARPFWKTKVSFGREYRERFDLFLFHVVTARTGEAFGVTHLYASFKEWWSSGDGPGSVEEGLKLLQRYAEAYRRIIEPKQDTRFDTFLARLDELDITTLHPLLLHLLVERSLAPSDLDLIATYLESYIIRRATCRLTTKNMNQVFLGLLRTAKAIEKVSPRTLETALLSGEGVSTAWPNDQEFRNAWSNTPMYQVTRSTTNLILRALEQQQRSSRQENVHLRDKPTIEHVMPQKWRDTWPAPTIEPGEDLEAAELRRDRLVHTIGNLTLLTQPLNSAVSNGAYAQKRPEITQHSALRLNSYFQHVTTWDEAAIGRRGEELLALAQVLWPYPKTAQPRSSLAASHHDVQLDPPRDEDRNGLTGALPAKEVLLQAVAEAVGAQAHAQVKRVRVSDPYCLVTIRGWPKALHYEFGWEGAHGPSIGLHMELRLGHPARDRLAEAIYGLEQAVQREFSGREVRYWNRSRTWRWLTVSLLPQDLEPGRIADGIAKLIDLTFAAVDLAWKVSPMEEVTEGPT